MRSPRLSPAGHTGTDFPSAQVKVALLGGHYESTDVDEEAVFGVVQVVS